jgi:hypothetical protein
MVAMPAAVVALSVATSFTPNDLRSVDPGAAREDEPAADPAGAGYWHTQPTLLAMMATAVSRIAMV